MERKVGGRDREERQASRDAERDRQIQREKEEDKTGSSKERE